MANGKKITNNILKYYKNDYISNNFEKDELQLEIFL